MKRKNRVWALLLCAVMALGTFTACGGDGGAQNGATGTGGTSGAENVFVFSGPNNIISWDPQVEMKTNFTMLTKLYYNTLVNLYGENNSVQPELATEWETSEDGKEWTFKLCEGVKFHNGEDFKSDSVVATLKRPLENTTLTLAASLVLLEDVVAVDDYTVTLKLSSPWAALPIVLADVPMLPPKMLAEKGDAMFDYNETNKPVGTGPWICDKWVPGQDAEFVRNDEYWNWGDDKSNVDRIIYRPAIEDTTRISGIQTGDLDMIDAVPVEQAEMLEKTAGIKVEKIYGAAIVHLGFRCSSDRLFSDVNARQAINHSINRELLVSSIAGGGRASTWPCPEGVLGFDPTAKVPEYNVEMAKELLGKTNYNGEELSFIAPNGVFARSKEVAQALLAMFTDAGFKVKLEIMENAAFQERRASGDYDIYLQRYPYSGGDPDSVVITRWLKDFHKSAYVNEELNNLIIASQSELDTTKREEMLREMFAVEWAAAAPHLSLYQQVTTLAYRENITGLRIRIDNVFDYSRVSKAK